MRFESYFLTFIFLIQGMFFPLNRAWAQSVPAEGVTLSDAQWASVQTRFETDITALLNWLQNYEAQKRMSAAEIADLQSKSAELRLQTRDQSNLFKEIRLKESLNSLKDKLEENSKADRDADLKQKEFEQKCLSLIDLYNGRIEAILAGSDVNQTQAALDAKVNQLSDLARRRNRTQTLLNQYRKKQDVEKLAALKDVSALKTNDKETLQLTMDLFKDRRKNLQDQMEKWTLELDGLRNELKLQGEMKDFLKDIQDMNADSNFPQGNLKPDDLEFLSGDSQKKKLILRLNDVQQKVLQGQKLLMQIDLLLAKVQSRLDSSHEGEKP